MRSTFALFALLLSLAASAQTLHVTIFPPRAVGDDLQGEWLVRISNAGGEITDARLSFTAHGAQVVGMAPPLVCAEDGCFLPSIPAAGRLDVRVRLHSNFRYGQITSVASVTRPGGERVDAVSYHTLWKDYMVTSTADSGPGTLRQAILDINAQCAATPCRAAFDIEQKIGGDFFHTVELHSPLPALNVPRSSVDGSTEDQSNTLGPSVALDGAMLHAGNGITVERGICDVKGIAIGNFPWNGIYASAQARVNVDSTYIGVNALGMVPKPNRSRGIASENVSGTITRSLIAYNGRSGIFFTGPINRGVEIIGNRIIDNGASGIYVGGNERMYQFTLIRDNIITRNAHFGVAIDPRALVIVQPNSIHGNGGGGIDIGLDGPTGNVDGFPGRGGIYPPPVITSARWDNGVTTITGVVQRAAFAWNTHVDLYANTHLDPDGFAEGETYLATVTVERNGTFTATLPRDLRGKYVNGVTLRNEAVPYDDVGESATSEFGRAMRVE